MQKEAEDSTISMGKTLLRYDAQANGGTIGEQTGASADKAVSRHIQEMNRNVTTETRQGTIGITGLFRHVYKGNLDGVKKFIMTSSDKEVSDALLRKHPVFKQTLLERALDEARIYKNVKDEREGRSEIYALFFVAGMYGPGEARTRISTGAKTLPAVVASELRKELDVMPEELSMKDKLLGTVVELADGFAQDPVGFASESTVMLADKAKSLSGRVMEILFPPRQEWNGYRYTRVDSATARGSGAISALTDLLNKLTGNGRGKRGRGPAF